MCNVDPGCHCLEVSCRYCAELARFIVNENNPCAEAMGACQSHLRRTLEAVLRDHDSALVTKISA